MKNPRSYNFDPNAWYWGVTMDTFSLKTPATVLVAGTIVNKEKDTGKIEEWSLINSASTGVLYVVAENTIAGIDRCVCILSGNVAKSSIVHPSGITWPAKNKTGVTIQDSMALRSQIILH